MEKLLTEDGDLTAEFEKALLEIFHRHDQDKDSLLNEAELDAFSKMCNDGVGFDELALQEIRSNFEVSEEGYLTEDGFLGIYSLQTNADPEETWKDLERHGYDRNLSLKSNKGTETRQDNKEKAQEKEENENGHKEKDK